MNGASGDCYRSLRRGIPILAATRTSARLVTAARGPRRHFPVRRPRRADVPARCRRARDRPAVYGVVIGGGNAGLCAALAARERGCKVLVLEAAPEAERGGNSRYTAGAMRVVYRGVEDLRALIPDLTDADIARTDFGAYSEADFFDDLGRVTEYRSDPELSEVLVRKSFDTLRWMREKGVRFAPMYGRQAFKAGDRMRFWGGLTVEAWGGGPGLIDTLTKALERDGIE